MTTGEVEVNPDALGALATKIMSIAIETAVTEATPAYGLKASRDII